MYSRSERATTCSRLLRERQYAVWPDLREQIQSKLHLHMRTIRQGHLRELLRSTRHGMIYSLKFHPTGAYLLATCSSNSFFLYDPRFNRVVCSKLAAHEDEVNCAAFVARGHFATGSEDGTVALWDARKVTTPIKVLQGHASSVKNIEYDERSNRLFTIAFDGQVLSWDLGNVIEGPSDVLMRIPQICRLRLAPDGSKLIITTRYSCLIVINNFDGDTIVKDMYNSFTVIDKIARGFYISYIRTVEILQKDERHFLKRKKNAISFHLVPPHFSTALSVCFHPSSEFVACRSLHGENFDDSYERYETTCLYDVRNTIPQQDSKLGRYYSDFPDHRMLAVKRHEIFAPDYIKEISFSPDGRLIAAPLSNTVKLLAASSVCPNFESYFHKPHQSTALLPHKLYDLHCPLTEHQSPVLCCAFAPRDILLATGCINGEIHIHQPVL